MPARSTPGKRCNERITLMQNESRDLPLFSATRNYATTYAHTLNIVLNCYSLLQDPHHPVLSLCLAQEPRNRRSLFAISIKLQASGTVRSLAIPCCKIVDGRSSQFVPIAPMTEEEQKQRKV